METPKWSVELHAHTSVSPCATVSPDEVIRIAEQKGLQAVAITDHDRIDAAQYIKRKAQFFVIIGEEIASMDGDIIGYFLQNAIRPGLSAKETIALIREQDGLVCIPHPCDKLRKHRLRPELLETILSEIDFLETWNARNVFVSANKRAERIALAHSIPQICGSDSHTRYEIGMSTMILDPFQSTDEFRNSISSGTCVRKKSPIWVHGITKLHKIKNQLFPKSINSTL
ncbi:MAG: PHP-associated domain-containing protein [Patescibacteria group bacterium]